MNTILRRIAFFGVVSLTIAATAAAARPQKSKDDDPDKGRPKLTLKAQPNVGISPARVVLTAELAGGANDFQEYYCPTVVWDWADGTESESTLDCEPYEAGKSQIKRRFTVEHVFRAGAHKVWIRLKHNDKVIASAYAIVQVQPGAGNDND
jgi:hypothetical protein